MKKTSIYTVAVIAILVGGFYFLNKYIYSEKQTITGVDEKNTEYLIAGERVKLEDGTAETEIASGSATKIITRYFGNAVRKDLNDDGREDVVFLLTQDVGGSGTFFYVVGALNTTNGYIGSDAVLLGDRIAPQTTEVSRNPSHKNVIVVNYADRAPGEPMTASPSVGKSLWLKLDPESMQFGQVEQDFSGEVDPSRMTLDMKKWVWIRALYNDGREVVPKQAGKFTLTFSADGTFAASTDCNGVGGEYIVDENSLSFEKMMSTLMFCEGSQERDFSDLLTNTAGYHFTSRGELVLDLKFDSGSVVFR